MYEPELEHEFYDVMTNITPAEPWPNSPDDTSVKQAINKTFLFFIRF